MLALAAAAAAGGGGGTFGRLGVGLLPPLVSINRLLLWHRVFGWQFNACTDAQIKGVHSHGRQQKTAAPSRLTDPEPAGSGAWPRPGRELLSGPSSAASPPSSAAPSSPSPSASSSPYAPAPGAPNGAKPSLRAQRGDKITEKATEAARHALPAPASASPAPPASSAAPLPPFWRAPPPTKTIIFS